MRRIKTLSFKLTFLLLAFSIISVENTKVYGQQHANGLAAFSTESLLLGEWKLIGIEKDAHTFFTNDDNQTIEEDEQLSLTFSASKVKKVSKDENDEFNYTIASDSTEDWLVITKDEVTFQYKVEEINHFSLLISSEVTINKGLDLSTEKIYYTYLRQGEDQQEINNILGNWFICSDSILEDFSANSQTTYRFYRNQETECSGVCSVSLELNSATFQLLHNVVQDDEKSFKFLSSSLIINLDQKLIYFKVDKGLVFDIVNLDENYLEIRLNQELTQRIL